MISAKEAKERSDKYTSILAERQLKEIERLIELMILKGGHEVIWDKPLEGSVKDKLINLGYKVTSSSDPRDYSAGNYSLIYISWKNVKS